MTPRFRPRSVALVAAAFVSLAGVGLLAGPLDKLFDNLTGGAEATPVPGFDINDIEGKAQTEKEKLPPATLQPGVVNCANLVYGSGKTSVCFQFGVPLADQSGDVHSLE